VCSKRPQRAQQQDSSAPAASAAAALHSATAKPRDADPACPTSQLASGGPPIWPMPYSTVR